MHDPEQTLLEELTRPGYKPVKAATLLKRLEFPPQIKADARTALSALVAGGKVLQDRAGKLHSRFSEGKAIGRLKRTRSGDGWVSMGDPRGREFDVFVSRRDLADAQDGDEVEVKLHGGGGKSDRGSRNGKPGGKPRGGRRSGRVTAVIQRRTTEFVGTYGETGGRAFVRVDGDTFLDPLPVGDPGAKGAQVGDKVVVQVLTFPTDTRPGEAVVIERLGKRGKPGVDELSIIREFGLPDEFPADVRDEAADLAAAFDPEDLGDRLDLTGETVVTIDPADARDFDDAISLKRVDGPGGKKTHWLLGVHIADVSHFVKPKSDLDREAVDRATSVYLPGRVIPMLPEVISNGLASLQQGKVRFTKTVFIEFTDDGVPVKHRFANSAIKVKKRFAYEQVMPVVENPDDFKRKVPAKIRELLGDMHTLSRTLRRRRFEAGALELHMPEVTIDLGRGGEVVGASEAHHDEAHEMIEEFMLAANVAVAVTLADKNIPFLRRNHADPDEQKLKTFADFVGTMGYKLKRYQSRHDLQAVLDAARDTPEQQSVNYALLRSMKQAEYSPASDGHYALAFPEYCHFTSPIRRYPDLTVHRLIGRLAHGKKPKTAGPEALVRLAEHCSERSRRAEQAERELTRVKLLEYLEDKVGEELDAVVTGVKQFGIFVRGIGIPAEGFVPVRTLGEGEYFDYDAAAHTLTGRAGRVFRLGMPCRIRVAVVDVEGRNLEFAVVAAGKSGGPKRGKPKRGGTKRAGGKADAEADADETRKTPAKTRRRRSKTDDAPPPEEAPKRGRSKRGGRSKPKADAAPQADAKPRRRTKKADAQPAAAKKAAKSAAPKTNDVKPGGGKPKSSTRRGNRRRSKEA